MNEQQHPADGHIIGLSLGPSSPGGQHADNTAPSITWLTHETVLRAGQPVPAQLTDPHLAPGLVFLLGKELTGPRITAATALAAVDRVYAAVEITDNTAPVHFVTGPNSRHPEDLDLTLEACLLEIDGQVFDSATGIAAHGHPAEALALAANTLSEQNITLQPGWLVFTGALTNPATITPKTTVTASFTHLGSITLAGS
jgi:2-oxo-3-hexenedioate decarboxylase